MELAGRPDGQKPHGFESLLDFYEKAREKCRRRRQGVHSRSPRLPGNLIREGLQYYHRYLSAFHLQKYDLVSRDTERNLRLFAFVVQHASRQRDKIEFDQYRPYVHMMRARAIGLEALARGDFARALREIDEGISRIRRSGVRAPGAAPGIGAQRQSHECAPFPRHRNPGRIPDLIRRPARRFYLKAPERTHAEQVADIKALVRLARDNEAAILAAISADFGNRSEFETKFAEIFFVVNSGHDAAKRLKHWMRPQRRAVDLMTFAGARNRLIPQPLGVVGVIVPWNYPLMLSLGPLVSIFAAGNRAMVKMSENSRRLAELLIDVSPKYFPEDKLAFFDDGGGRGPAFSSLPFDHLIFTGSGKTGRAVMASAARNLTPVTLELGGKSPAVVAPDFPIKTAARASCGRRCSTPARPASPSTMCSCPGPGNRVRRRLQAPHRQTLSGHQRPRLHLHHRSARLRPADGGARGPRAKGATLVNLAEGQTPDASRRKFPPHIVLHPAPDMEVMQREIFGPILPIRVYDDRQEVADAINAGDRPLALYPFTHDRATRDFYISRVLSGGVWVNDAMLHVCAARPAVRRRRRQRHGALPRPRGLRDFFEDEAGVPAGTGVVRPDDDAAAIFRTGETDG